VSSPLFLSIGDIGVDEIIAVDHIPAGDEKIDGRCVARTAGGMAANTAAALAQLGSSVGLIGAVGSDEDGVFALASLRERGVDTSNVMVIKSARTFRCVALLVPGGEKALIRLRSEAYLPAAADLAPAMFAGVTHVHATLGSRDLTARAFELAGRASVSLAIEHADLPENISVLRPLVAMASVLFCSAKVRSVLDPVLAELPAMPEIVTTLGPHGARLERRDGRLDAAAYKVAAIDSTGAGDCFVGAYLFATHALRRDGEHGLAFANAAAALSTLGYGAQGALARREDVEALLARDHGASAAHASSG
jgi:ribokinase